MPTQAAPKRCCGILFGPYEPGIHDHQGCHLAIGHLGPHEFVAQDGTTYQWETDWDCECEDCMNGDGDFCSIYWRVNASRKGDRG